MSHTNLCSRTHQTIKLEDMKYPMDKTHMGYFIIFNQYEYSRNHSQYYDSPRKGSIEDANNLSQAMTHLGFQVKIYDNQKTQEIKTKIKKYTTSSVNVQV